MKQETQCTIRLDRFSASRPTVPGRDQSLSFQPSPLASIMNAARGRVEGDVMSIKSRAIVKLAKNKPHWFVVPFVPLGMVVSSFVMSLLALRRTRRLWQRMG
jgi:hypothetical protein